MTAEYDFSPTLQFTPFNAVTYVQLFDIGAKLFPLEGKGLVIFASSAPDVANNPRYASFAWYDQANNVLKYWNGSAWVAMPSGAITSASQITDGIITLAKLNTAQGAALQIIRKNAANNAWEFVNILDAIANGSLDVIKLAGPGSGTGQVLSYLNGVPTWETSAALAARLGIGSGGSVDPNSIGSRSANSVLISNSSNSALWATFTDFLSTYVPSLSIALSKLAQNGASSGQVIAWNGANWAASNVTGKLTQEFIWTDVATYSGNRLPPVNASLIINTGTISFSPRVIRLAFVCVTAYGSYAAGFEIPATDVFIDDFNSNICIPKAGFAVKPNASNFDILVKVKHNAAVGTPGYYAADTITSANNPFVALNVANWALKVYAYA